jgi:transcriptional regulator with GAF, ATPase, and Fis domain
MARRPGPSDDALIVAADAIGELGGPAIVLDARLRVIVATPAARDLVGFDMAPGTLAPSILCGPGDQRPVAEAMAAGRPVTAVIDHPGRVDGQRITVRSVPLGRGDPQSGWLLLLDDSQVADIDGPVLFEGMWTQDAAMKSMFRVIERVAESDAPVLVRGETGTGKELVSRAIHALSSRRGGPLREINCAALPPNLLESELFGHVRGAFTGAVKDTPGHMQLADGGTLFLDEVAELPLDLQAKMLRVLETGLVTPVGGRVAVKVDVRLVSATHRALRQEVEAGRFRADLMYRLRVIPVHLPPLRARVDDIRLLVEKFVEEMNRRNKRKIEVISPAALEVLKAWPFPGNVRELRNVLLYAYAIGTGPILAPGDLPPELLVATEQRTALADDAPSVEADATAPTDAERESSAEAARIVRVLQKTGYNRERAAQILGINRVTLWRRMREYGIAAKR